MTDLEMTRLCAEAIGYSIRTDRPDGIWCNDSIGNNAGFYDPLRCDVQVMALEDWLLERGAIHYEYGLMKFLPHDTLDGQFLPFLTKEQRRHAIVECVAKMQAAKAVQP